MYTIYWHDTKMTHYADQWITREYPSNIPFIFIYLFPWLRTAASLHSGSTGSHECCSENWDKMNTLCLISANPGQKLKVLFSVEDVWCSSINKFNIVLWSNHVDCRPMQSTNINMLVMVMVTYSSIIRSYQMRPQHQATKHTRLVFFLSRLTGPGEKFAHCKPDQVAILGPCDGGGGGGGGGRQFWWAADAETVVATDWPA